MAESLLLGGIEQMSFKSTTSMLAIGMVALTMGLANPAAAQEEEAGVPAAAAEGGEVGDIVVTARKREERLQSVPVSISALGEEQLERSNFQSLGDLVAGLPNVSLAQNGSVKGTANFAIRGLSASGSIAGVDPAVGVVIDGVYVGLNNGLVLDTFDLESVQVLRGPQGTLFGRNVTGGAILLNTKKPSENFEVKFKTTIDGNPDGSGGLDTNVMGSVTGRLAEGIAGRLVVAYGYDDGYFVNQFNNSHIGRSRDILVRPSLLIAPSTDFDLTLRYEYQKSTGDAVPGTTFVNGAGVAPAFFMAPPGTIPPISRGNRIVSLDAPTYDNRKVHAASAEANWHVGFGDGTITNVAAYRSLKQSTLTDVDSQPVWIFHVGVDTAYEQGSNELRYGGKFGDLDVTTGLFYFRSKTKYNEIRPLVGVLNGGVSPARTQAGGGLLDVTSFSAYTSLDYQISSAISLNAGINLTTEKKSVSVASLPLNAVNCDITGAQICPYDFNDSRKWTLASPKLGVTYTPSGKLLLYASWARGFRSGLYNLRNTNRDSVNFGPGPIDPERADSFEVGFKLTFPGLGYLNAAAFYNHLADNQRTVQTPDPTAGLVQVQRNAADLGIKGLEAETFLALTDRLTFNANIGYTDARYEQVLFDLSGDGIVDARDKNLKVPKIYKVSYSLALAHEADVGNLGTVSTRVAYSYRSRSAQAENNIEFDEPLHMIDASLNLTLPDDRFTIGIYGKNLLDAQAFGGITTLPAALAGVPLGGVSAFQTKGRVIGAEAMMTF